MIAFIAAGLVVGVLSRRLLPGRQRIGLPRTLMVGVLGAVIGGTGANLVGPAEAFELNIFGFIVAVLGAVGLLAVVAERAGIDKGKGKSEGKSKSKSEGKSKSKSEGKSKSKSKSGSKSKGKGKEGQ